MLKFEVESLEGIDEAAQTFYKEKDGGGFVLQVAGVVSQSKFDEVNQKAVDATDEATRRRKTVERVTGKLGLESADGLDEALEALLARKPGKTDEDHQAVIDQIKAGHSREMEEIREKFRAVQSVGARSEVKAALASVNFHPEVIDDITATAMSRITIDEEGVRIMKADGSAPLAGSGANGLATFADLAKELAAARPSFLVDAGKGGGGKPPASGGAPVKKFSEMTGTELVALRRSNPEEYDRLKAAG